MDYWYEVLAVRKTYTTDTTGQPVKIAIHIVNGVVVEVQETY